MKLISIIGPSGSGKSTFLRCINKLEEPSSGHIYIDGMDLMDKNTDINKVRERVGMVFQHFNLFPNMTVLDNLTLSPIMVKRKVKRKLKNMHFLYLKKLDYQIRLILILLNYQVDKSKELPLQEP